MPAGDAKCRVLVVDKTDAVARRIASALAADAGYQIGWTAEDEAMTAHEDRHAAPNVLVVGPAVAEPLHVARRVRGGNRAVQILFVRPAATVDAFRTKLPFLPDLRDAWTEADTAQARQLHAVIQQAAEASREIGRASSLSRRLNRLLSRPPDTHERERRRRRLWLAERYLESVVLHAPDPIFALDADGAVIAGNPAAIELFGWQLGEAEAPMFVEALPEPQRSPIVRILRQVARGEPHPPVETQVQCQDGRRIDLEMNLAPIQDEDGEMAAVAVVARDVTERRRAHDQLTTALADKEILLREVHHRVKNNLQVINSLLSLQARALPEDQREPLFRMADRVLAMARLHARLSEAESLTAIPLLPFLAEICRDLKVSFGVEERVVFRIEGDAVSLGLDVAMPLLLLLTELLMNALRHAFPDGRSGVILLRAEQERGGLRITVQDNGVGFPEDVDIYAPRSVGLHVVRALARQAKAEVDFRSGDGAVCTLRIAQAA